MDEREVNRSSVTGQFVSDEEVLSNPNETVTEVVDDVSPWMKEWIRLGEGIQALSFANRILVDKKLFIDQLTIAAVIHTQVLKR